MANLPKVEIGIRGPVDSTGTADLRATDYQITMIFPDDEIVRGRLSLSQIEALCDLCNHFMTANK